MPTTAQQAAAAARQVFGEILEQHADAARFAARLAHVVLTDLDDEASERQIDYWRMERAVHDAIADEFDELAFSLTHGAPHAG